MIEVTGLEKSYGDFKAVSNVSFRAKKGDIVGFLGPNGAGKTTTIRILATFLPPTRGTAKIAGYDILTHADDVRRHIGYLPETPPLYPEMTVREYLHFVAEIKGVPKESIDARVESVIARCILGEAANKLCQHLSRGFRQRVGIAQAIIHDPSVIILDEPTSGLDPKQIIEIRNLIKSLGQDHTVILSTHILPEVTMVCNRVVIIDRGKVVLEEDLSDLLKTRTLEQVFLDRVGVDEASAMQGGAA